MDRKIRNYIEEYLEPIKHYDYGEIEVISQRIETEIKAKIGSLEKNYSQKEEVWKREVENATLQELKNIIREKIDWFSEKQKNKFESEFVNADIRKLIELLELSEFEAKEN